MASKQRYKLVFLHEHDKEFTKLYRKARSAFTKKTRDLEEDPFIRKSLRAALKGLWCLRIGKYRVIYEVLREEGTVRLITIGHRRKVYRPK